MFKYRMSTLTEIRRKALKRGLSKARSPASSKIFVFERRENCEIYRTKSNNKLTFPGICSILFSSFLRRSTNVITWKGCQGGKRWVAWEAREIDGSYFQCGFMIFLNIFIAESICPAHNLLNFLGSLWFYRFPGIFPNYFILTRTRTRKP